jgi:hypothetical protein
VHHEAPEHGKKQASSRLTELEQQGRGGGARHRRTRGSRPGAKRRGVLGPLTRPRRGRRACSAAGESVAPRRQSIGHRAPPQLRGPGERTDGAERRDGEEVAGAPPARTTTLLLRRRPRLDRPAPGTEDRMHGRCPLGPAGLTRSSAGLAVTLPATLWRTCHGGGQPLSRWRRMRRWRCTRST